MKLVLQYFISLLLHCFICVSFVPALDTFLFLSLFLLFNIHRYFYLVPRSPSPVKSLLNCATGIWLKKQLLVRYYRVLLLTFTFFDLTLLLLVHMLVILYFFDLRYNVVTSILTSGNRH